MTVNYKEDNVVDVVKQFSPNGVNLILDPAIIKIVVVIFMTINVIIGKSSGLNVSRPIIILCCSLFLQVQVGMHWKPENKLV